MLDIINIKIVFCLISDAIHDKEPVVLKALRKPIFSVRL